VEQRNSKAAGAGQVRVGVVLEGGSGEEVGEGLRGLRQERWVPRFWRWSGQGGVDMKEAVVRRRRRERRVKVRVRVLVMCIWVRRTELDRYEVGFSRGLAHIKLMRL